ncbi:MAG: PmoA family protein [Roseibacillus sp.]|jgi:hypothetical protein
MKLLPVLPVLILGAASLPAAELKVVETDEAITITRDEIPVLTYHKAEVPPPEGVDPIFKRSGFIHPLCAPNGEPVTGIHPKDHYHHLGIWHAWVKTKHGKDTPDFWNLKGKTGRVRYAQTIALIKDARGHSFAGFMVRQEHVAYKGAEKRETVVLREVLNIRAKFIGGRNVITYNVTQENVSREALVLPAYRYGGCLAYRAPHDWDKTNSDYLTSEGLDRTNSHQSRAKWVAMSGPTRKGIATLTVLIHPENHDFPQRLRTWPASSNNGAIFFNVVPIQEKPWEIAPGEKIVMNYQLVVSDGKPEKRMNDLRWKTYSKQP